jgi:DNA-binding CsgD family transcriptional regulator
MNRKPINIISLVFVILGVVLLATNIVSGGKFNLGLPLVFLMLGGIFTILVYSLRPKWSWAGVFYIPAALLIALGLIVLMNVITADWSAWAYAWLLLIAGLGVGVALANRQKPWHPLVEPISWGAALASVSLFALFGAIAGGLFIQVMAPILLIAGGISLRYLPLERFLPEQFLTRLHLRPPVLVGGKTQSQPAELVEPLSTRELEVLQHIEQGLSNQEIAAQLSIAPSTVKTHINNIFGKLGVQNRAQAVRRARALGLIKS